MKTTRRSLFGLVSGAAAMIAGSSKAKALEALAPKMPMTIFDPGHTNPIFLMRGQIITAVDKTGRIYHEIFDGLKCVLFDSPEGRAVRDNLMSLDDVKICGL